MKKALRAKQASVRSLPNTVLGLTFSFLSWRCKLAVLNLVSCHWNSTRAPWSNLSFEEEDSDIEDDQFLQVLKAAHLAKLESFVTDKTYLVDVLWTQTPNLAKLALTRALTHEDFVLLLGTLCQHENSLPRTRLTSLDLLLSLCVRREQELVSCLSQLESVPAIITSLDLIEYSGSLAALTPFLGNLQNLSLVAPDEQQSLAFVQFLPCLTRLVLEHYRHLGAAQLGSLKHVSNLTALSLSCCEDLVDAALMSLGECVPMLTTLELSSCKQFSEAVLPHLPRNLAFFDASHSDLRLDRPTMWATLTQLRVLHIENCDVQDDSLQCLANLLALQELDVSLNHDLTGTGFIWLRHLNLQTLNVRHCTKLTVFDDVPSGLKSLDLSINDLGDDFGDVHALKWINSLRALEDLDLSRTKVSDHGMRSIGSLPRLRSLNLCGCELLTNMCMDLICEQFPNLQTLYSFTFEFQKKFLT
jgi:Leucine-rich repeat (LRR) protein